MQRRPFSRTRALRARVMAMACAAVLAVALAPVAAAPASAATTSVITAPASIEAGSSVPASVALTTEAGTGPAALPVAVTVSTGSDAVLVSGSGSGALQDCSQSTPSTLTCVWVNAAPGQTASVSLEVSALLSATGTATLTVTETTAGGATVPLGSQPLDVIAGPSFGTAFDIPVFPLSLGGGNWFLTTYISVNGSDPIHVTLDTGTSILALNPGAVKNADPAPFIPQPTVDVNPVYDGSGINGELATGVISVVDGPAGRVVATTPVEVAFVNGVSCVEPGGCPVVDGVTEGVWGIGPELGRPLETGGVTYRLYSPVTQFGSPSDQGLTIDYVGETPTVRVGPVAPVDGDVVVDRKRLGQKKPNGQDVFSDPPLCWTITVDATTASGCQISKIDSGQPGGQISGPQFDTVVIPVTAPPQPGSGQYRIGDVPPGALVSWSVEGAADPFAGVLAQKSAPNSWAQYIDRNGQVETSFNTGQGFYRSHVVAYDNVNGRTYISPTPGAPRAPTVTAAAATAGEVTVQWTPPAGEVGVTSWAVTLHDANGATLQRQIVGASTLSAAFTGTTAGTTYVVNVAGINAVGLGRWSASVDAVAALPATGGGPVPWWVPLSVFVIGAACTLVAYRNRFRRQRVDTGIS